MNFRSYRALAIGAALVGLAVAACTDATVEPKSIVSEEDVFRDPSAYQAYMAKLYAGLALTGQQGPNGNPDIGGIDEGFSNYVRVWWYSQALPTDEAILGWGDPGVPDLIRWNWDASNSFISALYNRVYFQIQLINEFLRQTTDAKLAERGHNTAAILAEVHTYRAEARFLRALSYWHGLDAFGPGISLVTDAEPLSATPPPASTGTQVYDFIVTELNAILGDLPPAGAAFYGRANQYAAQMLLANVHLNAGVYTGTTHYDLALNAAQAAIAGPFQLDTMVTLIVATPRPPLDTGNAAHMDTARTLRVFMADNDQSREMIFPVTSDGVHTQTWGGTTFLIHAACGGNWMDTRIYGTNGCWWGLRMKAPMYNLYAANDLRAANFVAEPWNDSQTVQAANVGDWYSGKAAPKYFNRRINGSQGSNSTHPDTDFPMFRLSEAYLIYAEANVRGGGGSPATALGYVNALRTRAGIPSLATLSTDSILAERGRELRWEARRRTDLIRYGLFTGGAYLWEWKGNTATGSATSAHYNLYPIPANELIANPNLSQNPGY